MKREIKKAFNELLIRLEDSRLGYLRIANTTDIEPLQKWMKEYAQTREELRDEIQIELIKMKEIPEIDSSLLGAIHRKWIEFKLDILKDSPVSIISEIERGCNYLLNDYHKILKSINMETKHRDLLSSQRRLIEKELSSLKNLKEHLEEVLVH